MTIAGEVRIIYNWNETVRLCMQYAFVIVWFCKCKQKIQNTVTIVCIYKTTNEFFFLVLYSHE